MMAGVTKCLNDDTQYSEDWFQSTETVPSLAHGTVSLSVGGGGKGMECRAMGFPGGE